MLKKFLPLILIIFCGLSGAAQEPADSVFDEDPYFLLMGEADRSIAGENWKEAIDRLHDVLRVRPVDPSNALVYYDLGVCYSYLGEDSLALANYDESLGLAPRMTITLLAKGRLLLGMSRDYEAYEAFETAIEVDSLSTDARYYHGMMALYGGQADVAERDFAVLRRVAPHTTDTKIALSTMYSLTGRELQAIPLLRDLIEEHPEAEYFATLAGCYLALGYLTEASATIGEGLSKYPDDAELYYYRAWLNRDLYRPDDAAADARRAVQLGASLARVNILFQ